MKRPIFVLVPILLIALLASGAYPVSAHAALLNSIPADNASVPSSPPQVELFFSESIDPSLSKVSVLDANGKKVDAGDAHLDPADATHLIVSVTTLADGVYSVMWAAVSATDGHQTTGSYPFAVGNMAMGSMMVSQATTTAGNFTGGIIFTKVLLYFSIAAIIGALLFAFLVWRPSLHKVSLELDDLAGFVDFSKKLLLWSLVLLVAADLLSLFAQAGQVSGHLVGWPWQPEFKTVLLSTRFGALVIARLGLALILGGLLLPRANRWNRYLAVAVAPLLLLTFSLESHAAAEPLPVLPVLSDWLHFAAISVWVGGLVSFLGGMRATSRLAPTQRTSLTSILIPHFTLLAMSSVGFLVLSGLYSAYLRIGPIAALIDTTYGRVLLLKLVVIAPMLALGGFHFLVTTPLMKRAAGKTNGSLKLVRLFRALLAGEMVLGMLVLVLVAVLTTLPPVRAVATSAGFNKTVMVNDLKVSLSIDPGHAGMNTFTARITSQGKLVTDAKDVSLEFTSMTGMMAASKAAMTNMGNGMYSLKGGYLAMADQWDVKVVVMRTGQFDAYAGFTVPISQVVNKAIAWQPITTGLFAASALCLLFFALMVGRGRAREWSWV